MSDLPRLLAYLETRRRARESGGEYPEDSFVRATLIGADLRGATARWASFEGAKIKGAAFEGADLEGANGLTGEA